MKLLKNSSWCIASFRKSFLWLRHLAERDGEDNETWLINAPRRYIFNTLHLTEVEPFVETISEFRSSALYKPLIGHPNLSGARILVERCRERGIGDMLFLTGPMHYLHHLSGASCQFYAYSLALRADIWYGQPMLVDQKPQHGPIQYEELTNYHYHWMVDTVTEFDEEPDQLNVYDALYKQLGLPYDQIDPMWKRPYVYLDQADLKNLDSLYHFVYMERKYDMRKTGYYVVAPLTSSSLRSADYSMWLALIKELAQRRPVVVIGNVTQMMPNTDITFNEFYESLSKLGQGVINLIGNTPLRVVMAVISKAVCTVTLDSAPLYISQALRVPSVSLWGTHDPGVRIGYDKDYMDLAVWPRMACRHSPCFAFQHFPPHKCPREDQHVCEVLHSVQVTDVLNKVNAVESAKRVKFNTKPVQTKVENLIALPPDSVAHAK